MWYSNLVDEDELLTPDEFLAALRELDEATAPAIEVYASLIDQLEQRLSSESEHECPTDHSVYESMCQAKVRLAESVMWLRSALVTKMTGGGAIPVLVPEGGDGPPN